MTERDPKPEAPAKRVRRSAEEARRVILDAAEKRLREGGPEAIRLQDIAADVGISHPAILHHFASRDGLTDALERRAMERLREDLIAALSQVADESGVIDVIERVFSTLGDAGHARMLAWRSLQAGAAPGADDEQLLRSLADLVHRRRGERAREEGGEAPLVEESDFAVRLAAAAMLGDGVFGRFLDASLGGSVDPERQRRFRAWFARLLSQES